MQAQNVSYFQTDGYKKLIADLAEEVLPLEVEEVVGCFDNIQLPGEAPIEEDYFFEIHDEGEKFSKPLSDEKPD